MPATHEGYPEIIDAYESEGHHYGLVRVYSLGEPTTFEFGVPLDGYYALRRILTSRPFETEQVGGKYRYFFMSGGRESEKPGSIEWRIHVVQGKDCHNFYYPISDDLYRNLLWFLKLRDQESARYLKQV